MDTENTGGGGGPDTCCSPGGRCVGPAASHQGDQPRPAPWNAINTTDTTVPARSSTGVVKDTILPRQEGKQGPSLNSRVGPLG